MVPDRQQRREPPQNAPTWSDLSPAILRILELEGVHSASDWLRLGDRARHRIFGVTRYMAALISVAARGTS
jgi:hypothetical protein